MKKLTFLFITFLLIACERQGVSQPDPAKTNSVQVLFFAAGYCHPCKHEMPILQKWHDDLPLTKKNKIKPTVYLIAGNPASKPATPEAADEFRKETGISFEVIPDKYARVYRKFYSSGTTVPATVVLAEEGNVLRAYNPGVIQPTALERDIDGWLK
jgi:thiol-disulfide isomerase/thioredoxin